MRLIHDRNKMIPSWFIFLVAVFAFVLVFFLKLFCIHTYICACAETNKHTYIHKNVRMCHVYVAVKNNIVDNKIIKSILMAITKEILVKNETNVFSPLI